MDSEKVHKKVQKRKNSRKGVFWGTKFQKVKSIGGSPVSDIGILWVASARNFFRKIFLKFSRGQCV